MSNLLVKSCNFSLKFSITLRKYNIHVYLLKYLKETDVYTKKKKFIALSDSKNTTSTDATMINKCNLVQN